MLGQHTLPAGVGYETRVGPGWVGGHRVMLHPGGGTCGSQPSLCCRTAELDCPDWSICVRLCPVVTSAMCVLSPCCQVLLPVHAGYAGDV